MRQVKLRMTRELAWAMATDAANTSMRTFERTAWNEEDYDLAIRTFEALCPEAQEVTTYAR
jgi:hypothetical protein